MSKKYSMLVWSNFKDGLKEEYEDWYAGQHIHDLLRIPGFTGCRFFKLTDKQLSPDLERKFDYLMIWDVETDDLESVTKEIQARIDDGRTVFVDAFDQGYYDEMVTPVTKYVTSEEIKGKSVEQVLEVSELNKELSPVQP